MSQQGEAAVFVQRARSESCYRLREGVRVVGDEVLFDGVWGNFYRASASAARLLDPLAHGASLTELTRRLTSLSGMSETRAAADVMEFLSTLEVLGVIEECRP